MRPTPTKNSKSKFLLKPLLIVLPIAIFAWLAFSLYQFFTADLAYQVARPIEDALMQAGAVKKCSRSSIGRDPSSDSLSYGAIYEIQVNTDQAKQIIKNALTKDSQLPTTDFKYDNEHHQWTVSTSKPSPYDKLQTGQAKVGAAIYEQRHFDSTVGKKFCTLDGEGGLPGITTLDIGVVLPAYK